MQTNDRVVINFSFRKEHGVNRLQMEIYPAIDCGVVGSFIFNNVTREDIDSIIADLNEVKLHIKD